MFLLFEKIFKGYSHLFLDHIKNTRELEKEEVLESELNHHNFEADMYLEKLDQENEKVIEIDFLAR